MSVLADTRPKLNSDLFDMVKFLSDHPESKWGFTVYRCTYKSDDEWNRFIDYLNMHLRFNLESDGALELYERWDWNVQEDQELFEDAVPMITQEHFNRFVRPQLLIDSDSARCYAYLHVEQSDVERVLYESGGPTVFDAHGKIHLSLVPWNDDEGEIFVGVSYIAPRIYTILEACSWEGIEPDDSSDVVCP